MSRILLGTFLSFLFLQESVFEKLDGYKFPVYSTDFCPKNETEWKTRSNLLNCTEENGYTCLPNEHFTELLEFCYIDPHILIEKGLCLYLIKSNSLVHGYKCNTFQFGCPTSSYLSTKIYNYPVCLLVENGCFYAEPTCRRTITTYDRKTTKQIDIDKSYPVSVQGEIDTIDDKRVALFITVLAVYIPIFLSIVVFIIFQKKIKKFRKKESIEDIQRDLDNRPVLVKNQHKQKYPKKDINPQRRTRTSVYIKEQWERANVQKIKSKSTRYAVAAIDFGTAYSGYAYSWKNEWGRIHINKQWSSGYCLSPKAPTTMLLNPNKTFCAFGYEAECLYSELDALNCNKKKKNKGKRDKYYFFQRFKDILYEQNLDIDHDVEDITGKKLKAIMIISMLIEYLKKSLIYAMNLSIAEGVISETDVDFVLAVPAKAGERAKAFMQNAAKKAGIAEDQLTIVFEEEAISSYCQHMPIDHPLHAHTQDDILEHIPKNVKEYIVVNLGGERVDITVIKQAEDGTLMKLFPSTIDHSGGFSVRDEYEKFMEKIGDKDILKSFEKDNMEDFLIMLREIETKRPELSCANVKVNIPYSFHNFFNTWHEGGIEKALQTSIYKDSVTYSKFKLSLSLKEFDQFFQKAIQNVLDIIEHTLQETGVNAIVMVGGYADCRIIKDSFRKRFEIGNYSIVKPFRAGLAVLKGAVYLGHVPNTKQSRVECYIYV